MADLDPRIEVIRAKFGLDESDFWELPQKKGTWVAKHSALEVAAVKAHIVFDNPQIIEAKSEAGIAVVAVAGSIVNENNRREWSIGEASPKNNKNAYPWAMAEKRAKDRVILKLIGIHGLVYSDTEADFDEPEAPKNRTKWGVPVAEQRDIFAALRDEIDACLTLEDLGVLWRSPAFQTEFKKLQPGWQDKLTEHKDERKSDLSGGKSRQPVAPDFSRMETPNV